MKANKKPKTLRSVLPTETAAPVSASPALVSMAPESASVTTTQPDAAVDANLPPDVVVLPPKAPESVLTRQAESPAATAQPVKENVVAAPQRTSGAGWFIPPQRPSQFGVKKG